MTRFQKSMKGPGQKLVIIACEWEQLKDHYDAVASFKLPTGVGMTCVSPHSGEPDFFPSSGWECASHFEATHFVLDIWRHGRDLYTLWSLVYQIDSM
jgi:hypothetical protein